MLLRHYVTFDATKKPLNSDFIQSFSFESSSMLKINLYGTSACHLCDEAKATILSVLPDSLLSQFSMIDIMDDDFLYSQYSLSIPVFKIFSDEAQLNWPFSREDIQEILAKYLI